MYTMQINEDELFSKTAGVRWTEALESADTALSG